MPDKKPGTAWNSTKIMAIVLVIIGIAVSIYFGYSWLTLGANARTGLARNGFAFNRTFNQSNPSFNQSRFNSTRTGRFVAASPLFNSYIEGIVIGILVLLLGAMTFKYANLKIATRTRK